MNELNTSGTAEGGVGPAVSCPDSMPSYGQKARHRIYLAIFGEYLSLKKPVREAPWWMRDRYGWPIELFPDRSFRSLLRVCSENLAKMSYW